MSKNGGKEKGVVGKFSFRIVCQNHIPISLFFVPICFVLNKGFVILIFFYVEVA